MCTNPDRTSGQPDEPKTAPKPVDLPCPMHPERPSRVDPWAVTVNYVTIPVTVKWWCGECAGVAEWQIRDYNTMAFLAARGVELVKVDVKARRWAHEWNGYLESDVAPAGSDLGSVA